MTEVPSELDQVTTSFHVRSWLKAGEAVIRPARSRARASVASTSWAADARAKAIARARAKVRRYCAANRLTTLFTLTYADEPSTEQTIDKDMRGFIRRLRRAAGGDAFPYCWVREGGLESRWHVHLALQGHGLSELASRLWTAGAVDIERTGARSKLDRARCVASYLLKEINPSSGLGRGRPSYHVGRGFQPPFEDRLVDSLADGVEWADRTQGSLVPIDTWLHTDSDLVPRLRTYDVAPASGRQWAAVPRAEWEVAAGATHARV